MTQVHLPPDQAWTFARLPELLTAHLIEAKAVTHVGAHHGEEVAIYRQCGFQRINLIEPDPRSVAVLRDQFGDDPQIFIVALACALKIGFVTLHQAERTVWSGLQPHPTADGVTVEVPALTLDYLLGEANVLTLDTQGSELDLLHQATRFKQLDTIIVETSRRPDDGAAFYDDAVAHMNFKGWQVAEEWVHDNSGFTDTVFVRT